MQSSICEILRDIARDVPDIMVPFRCSNKTLPAAAIKSSFSNADNSRSVCLGSVTALTSSDCNSDKRVMVITLASAQTFSLDGDSRGYPGISHY
jgi:hypothetical protein